MIYRRMPAQLRVVVHRAEHEVIGVATPPAWTEGTPCSQTDPGLFFPEKGVKGYSPQKAKKICRTQCEVREKCLEWALTFERINPTMVFGIYGGMTPNERKALLKSNAA